MSHNERRPRETASADEVDELAQRRERGRRAQRAFRQRQVDTIQELRASNEAMQAAIVSLARVAARVDSAELTTAMQEACRVAGVDKAQPTSDGAPISSNSDHSLSIYNKSATEPASRLHTITHFFQRPPSPKLPTSQDVWAQNPDNMHRTGRMSPRLSYGVWFEPPASLDVEYPPIDIIPYLQEDKTLASVVFWASISWGFRILGAALNGHPEAAMISHQVFGTILPMKPDRHVLDGLHARLIYRQNGTVDRHHPGNKPELGPMMHAAMVKSCEETGTPLRDFLTPLQMEQLLRSRLGAAYSTVDRSVRGLGTPEETARLRVLVDAMVKSSVCLGDGPRWHVDKAASALDAWTGGEVGDPWHFAMMPAHQQGAVDKSGVPKAYLPRDL
ncbi:hypothetical protein F5X68DRAFT_274801 [Plectosphaerella plurivora]|uniref:BZIP domain-containing protein n=1 Tax=Plectosphaerella plurivora TaxID=936078 RepID=A0A9P8VGX2_9PEZI|nr:hypothetical protein F5X68DRAFT_274801 [Plectosphaerella plurivora]